MPEVPPWVALLTSRHLGSPITATDWVSGRVGVVWQVRLADGRTCILKSRPATPGLLERLREVAALQSQLASLGLPVPTSLADPAEVEQEIVTFESVVAPVPAEVDREGAREASLTALLSIVEAGERLDLTRRPGVDIVSPWADSDVTSRGGDLWPTPHDVALFGRSFDGASADITALASAAVDVLAAWWHRPERVLGHDDWEAQNLVFTTSAGRPAVGAIYDTEALALMPEPVLAGASAVQHHRGLPDTPDAPALDQVAVWIEDFAARRGTRPALWHRAAWAAAAWGLAYDARCDELTGSSGPGTHRDACRHDHVGYLSRLTG